MKTHHQTPIITIDGPSGAGKGTLAFRLAKQYGFELLDSGALYRIVGLMAHQAGLLDKPDEDKLAELTSTLNLSFRINNNSQSVDIYIDEQPLLADIRNETVGGYASVVATFAKVRTALLQLQRNIATNKTGLVADGRDMGTVVFANAAAKIYLTADSQARAKRRYEQLINAGQPADYQAILADIIARDDRDENRAIAPSRPADDALVIDSSSLTANEVFHQAWQFCQQRGIV